MELLFVILYVCFVSDFYTLQYYINIFVRVGSYIGKYQCDTNIKVQPESGHLLYIYYIIILIIENMQS